MGGSSSTEQKVPAEQLEIETLATSTGALSMLKSVFSKLADNQSNAIPLDSLQQCLRLTYSSLTSEAPTMPDFAGFLDHLGASIVDLLFSPEKQGISWVEFVRGYIKCCGRMSTSMSINILLRVYAAVVTKARFPSKLEFESDDADSKIGGSLLPTEVHMLLWMCWAMSWNSRTSKSSRGKANLCLPDINHLVLSAVLLCTETGNDLIVRDCDISSLEVQLPAVKFLPWVLSSVPSLTDCLVQFVNARLHSVAYEDASDPSSSSSGDNSSKETTHLLTRGRAWAISLSLRSPMNEEILKVCFANDTDQTDENLIYRSSLHGKGLNRFWSNIEGYNGPLLLLVSAIPINAHEGGTDMGRCIVGALTQQGFENKDTFYGSFGNLYSINPVFHVYPPSGKEKNFVYSHLHATGRVYEPHPKFVGIAFGGTTGNERIFIDEDFAKITIRHHAVDKTYKSGSLLPNQGFLPVEASILEVEVWGLGGKTAKEVQASLKKREQLFTDQRRKVDLKTFANWEDSPEKMMMDMVSDPNGVRREER